MAFRLNQGYERYSAQRAYPTTSVPVRPYNIVESSVISFIAKRSRVSKGLFCGLIHAEFKIHQLSPFHNRLGNHYVREMIGVAICREILNRKVPGMQFVAENCEASVTLQEPAW
jgi:hypothetical protein